MTLAGNDGGSRSDCGLVTCVDCTPRFGNCVFSSNSFFGAGIIYGRNVSAALVNCVFANTGACVQSSRLCNGGTCAPTSTFSLVNCTLVDNRGAAAQDANAEFTNCILWNCAPYGTPVVPPASTLHACLTDRDPAVASRGVIDFSRRVDVVLCGMMLEVPTFVVEQPDYRLRADSPGVDAGLTGGAPVEDLDDHGRPCGNGVDIGAYEQGDCANAARGFQRGDANDDGRVNIGDAIYILGYLFAKGPSPQCVDAADTNDDGRLNIADALTTLMYLFARGGDLAPPFRVCGRDPSADPLGCTGSANCP